MVTIGTVQCGLRITKGRLSRRGRWHGWQPCIFFLWKGKKVKWKLVMKFEKKFKNLGGVE